MSRPDNQPAPFRDLIEQSALHGALADVQIVEASLRATLAGGADPLGVVAYMAALGIEVRSVEDFLLINLRTDEEELSAHRVAEGIAITVASQGDWVLFRP